MAKKQTLLLGAHMSIAGGFEQALIRGDSIGCTAIQIFTTSNRQWAVKTISEQEGILFKKTLKSTSIKAVVAHASYLLNIGSFNPVLLEKSTQSLLHQLQQCDILGIPYLIIHPGSHNNTSESSCLQRIAHTLDHILDVYTGITMILLENMAGQGSSVCYTFEHIAEILSLMTNRNRVGVCFDTCHAFAAGYDFTSPELYQKLWDHFDRVIGLDRLKAIHLNDSKKPCGSYIDRHEEIGQGLLGIEAFKLLCNDPNLLDIPKILETPNDTLEGFAHNIRVIKELVTD